MCDVKGRVSHQTQVDEDSKALDGEAVDESSIALRRQPRSRKPPACFWTPVKSPQVA